MVQAWIQESIQLGAARLYVQTTRCRYPPNILLGMLDEARFGERVVGFQIAHLLFP
jgi:hypothetical protein